MDRGIPQKETTTGSSPWTQIATSGVPQGSVIGPLLFLILMYDITKDIMHSIISSFADDTKAWKAISSLRDEVKLQSDLDSIYTWAQQNNMKFNSDKFQAIRFAMLSTETMYLDDMGKEIDQLSVVKDLGIYISLKICPLTTI